MVIFNGADIFIRNSIGCLSTLLQKISFGSFLTENSESYGVSVVDKKRLAIKTMTAALDNNNLLNPFVVAGEIACQLSRHKSLFLHQPIINWQTASENPNEFPFRGSQLRGLPARAQAR